MSVHPTTPRRRSSSSHKQSRSRSRSEFQQETDPGPPHVDRALDNTLPAEYFKKDLLSVITGVKIPGWSLVTECQASKIEVQRISGALTNTVYVISPPCDVKIGSKNNAIKAPKKLLLRLYGSQVGYLIDREKELAILARLSLKKIGPRLLGTFRNGRIEQYLHAITLTRDDLRDPDTSRQIAKRMRELHDNIELTDLERSEGPNVWMSFDKWKQRAIVVMESLTQSQPEIAQQVLQSSPQEFIEMADKYRKWITDKLGGADQIKKQMVFSHNDTQYGNILRIQPPAGSPLLYPRNEHRRLVVIDFEYSAANPRGIDIADHFCEWMSDYSANPSHEIFHDKYPTREEQANFVEEYVYHGQYSLDGEEDTAHIEVQDLLREAELWRPAVSLFWCVWGIVQAPGPDMETQQEELTREGVYKILDPVEALDVPESDAIDDSEALFDYLEYSAEKARLFWSDMIKFGLASEAAYTGKTKYLPQACYTSQSS